MNGRKWRKAERQARKAERKRVKKAIRQHDKKMDRDWQVGAGWGNLIFK
jgi:hypothetical protein